MGGREEVVGEWEEGRAIGMGKGRSREGVERGEGRMRREGEKERESRRVGEGRGGRGGISVKKGVG